MSVIRRSFLMLALSLVLPAALQAQFGGLGKILEKARAKVDSAKNTVDSAQAVVDSGKATAHEAANLGRSNAAPSKGHANSGEKGKADSAQPKKAGSASASSSGRSSNASTRGGTLSSASTREQAHTQSAAQPTAQPTAQRAAPTKIEPSTNASTRTGSSTSKSGPAITEDVYEQFARGYSVEKAMLKANPGDPQGALNAAVSTSGLSKADYSSVKGKILVYEAYAGREEMRANNPLLTTADISVLDAHKGDLTKLMAAENAK